MGGRRGCVAERRGKGGGWLFEGDVRRDGELGRGTDLELIQLCGEYRNERVQQVVEKIQTDVEALCRPLRVLRNRRVALPFIQRVITTRTKEERVGMAVGSFFIMSRRIVAKPLDVTMLDRPNRSIWIRV